MSQLTGVDVARLALGQGLSIQNAIMAVAIAWAESGLRTDAVGHNPFTAGCPGGSRDRGLWQINDCYHPDVSDACAFDPACNAAAMNRISSHGTNWNPWSTFTNGAYQRYYLAAATAVAGATGTESSYDYIDDIKGRIRNGENPFHAVQFATKTLLDYVGKHA